MHSVELTPVADTDQTQRPFDLFLIFAGANIVATTLQIGASLPELTLRAALAVIAAGSIGGGLLVAVLAPIGSKVRVPSIVATRAALGYDGAQLVAIILFLTNYVWIALNNVIAASITSELAGQQAHQGAVAVVIGLVAVVIVLGGPRAVGYADRFAVPLLAVSGVVFTVACLRATWPGLPASSTAGGAVRGFDVVFGYQTTWLLMFGDYSRYTKSGRAAGIAVFAGLALTALWFIPLGLVASTVAHSSDPGAMVRALGLGWWGGILIVLATLTTNFVNIYMSSLAWKSLAPGTSDGVVIWSIGIVGTALSAVPGVWLEQYSNFMIVLGALLVPVGGVLVAHYYIRPPRLDEAYIAELYDPAGVFRGISTPGVIAWAAGAAAFFAAGSIGGTLPSLAVSVLAYRVLQRSAPTSIHSPA